MSHGLMLDFRSPCEAYRLTFDDNGRVAYAYLKSGHAIVGDVWLYNRCPAPATPEWTERSGIPFANPREFVADDGHLSRTVGPQDVLVDWEYEEDSPVAYVYVFEDLLGVVGVGDKPGYARHAIKSGPLAKIMAFES